jgi:ABC-2 type transport system ATP-binding protein
MLPVSDARPLAEFDSVSKWYGPVIAVNDVHLRIEPGITGLVGPNGAGKSTLIKLLTGHLRPSLGGVHVYGLRAWQASAKSHIGYCPDSDAFYEEMSGRSFVTALARMRGMGRRQAAGRTEQVLDQVGMADRADRPLASYSKGMRQRIKLAQALVHDPDLLVLDEPLNGVDPLGRTDFLGLFEDLAAAGKAILISSHILDEMDKLADRVLFMCRGRIVASGTLSEIREMLDEHPFRIRVSLDRPRELAVRLMEFPSVQSVELANQGDLLVQVRRPRDFFPAFAGLVSDAGFQVERLRVLDASTEAVFDYLMRAAMQP